MLSQHESRKTAPRSRLQLLRRCCVRAAAGQAPAAAPGPTIMSHKLVTPQMCIWALAPYTPTLAFPMPPPIPPCPWSPPDAQVCAQMHAPFATINKKSLCICSASIVFRGHEMSYVSPCRNGAKSCICNSAYLFCIMPSQSAGVLPPSVCNDAKDSWDRAGKGLRSFPGSAVQRMVFIL